MFLRDGSLQAAAVQGDSIRLWRLPKSLPPLHELELRTWVMSGTRLNEFGQLEDISNEDWVDLRQELRELTEHQSGAVPAK